ncbi:VOC family protein [Cellulosimicrobium terreum]|nr:VOC family protein [Cellulosimicrobium terreum]
MSTIQPVIVTAYHATLLAFYTELFGAEVVFRRPARGPVFSVGLRIGDTDLALVARADADDRRGTRILLSIGVDDVDETVGRVEALGGSVERGGKDMPWGERVAHVQDPDGNPLNLTRTLPTR